MTEQEKREKEIEEMRFIIRTSACKDVRCSLSNYNCTRCQATRLYDAGYRKVDEVRKETAKEIYKDVLYLRELMVNNEDSLCILRNVESWAKEDGVEIENETN